MELAATFEVEPGWLAWGIGDRDPLISVESLSKRLEGCTRAELNVIAALLDVFLLDRERSATKTWKKKLKAFLPHSTMHLQAIMGRESL